VLIPVAQGMKPGDLGAILASMNPEAAQKLTVKLANKLSLPQTMDAVAPPPAPGPVTAALNPATTPPAGADQPIKKRAPAGQTAPAGATPQETQAPPKS